MFICKKQNGFVPGKSNIFGDDSDEDSQAAVSASLQKESLKSKVKKQTQLEIDKALNDDPNVYEYDNIYDEIHTEKLKTDVRLKNQADKKPKYIEGLLKSANQRKKEQEKRMERKIQLERQAEGEEFKEKEEFVTSAYKKKLLEMQEEEDREKREAEMEALLDVTKQKDMSGFYRYLYHQQTADSDVQEKESEKVSSVTVKEEKASSEEKEKIDLEKNVKKILPKYERKHQKTEPTSSDDNSEDESKHVKRSRPRSSSSVSSTSSSSSSSSSNSSQKDKSSKQKDFASSKATASREAMLEDSKKYLSKNQKRYQSDSEDHDDQEQVKKRKTAATKSSFSENKSRSQRNQYSRSRSRSREWHHPASKKFRDRYSRSRSREDGRDGRYGYRDNRYRAVRYERRSRSRDRFNRRSGSRSREKNRFDRHNKRSWSRDRTRSNRYYRKSRSRSRDRVERYNKKSRSRSRDKAYKYSRKSHSRSHSRDRMDKYSKNRSRSRDRTDKSNRKSRSHSRDRTERFIKNRSQQKNSSSQGEIRDWHSEEHQKSQRAKSREDKISSEQEKREIVKLDDPPLDENEKNGNLPMKSGSEKMDSQQHAPFNAATEKSEKAQCKDPMAKYAKRTVGDAFIEAQQRYFRRKMLQKPAIVVADND